MEKKVWIFLVLTFVISYSISMNGKKGKTENVVSVVGNSERFKASEIKLAIDCVRKEFKGFTNCEMTKLYYDEEKSNMEINNYLLENQEIENVKNTDKKILLYCILILMLG